MYAQTDQPMQAKQCSQKHMRRGDPVDVQRPSVAEARLVVGPVSALRARVHELLGEWPGNPLLEQLTTICKRLLGESAWILYPPFLL